MYGAASLSTLLRSSTYSLREKVGKGFAFPVRMEKVSWVVVGVYHGKAVK